MQSPVQTTTVLTGVTAQQDGTGYEAVSIPGWQGGDTSVDLSYACSPTGPGPRHAGVHHSADHPVPNEIAYIPTFHPELSSPSGLSVSYDIDTLNSLSALEQDVHQYQPQFLQLKTDS